MQFSLTLLLYAGLVLFAPVQNTVQAADPSPPNVILIFADDLGYGDVSCFNKERPFKTPNIDRMAAEGARLTSFYVPTPYCAPSRGTILTEPRSNSENPCFLGVFGVSWGGECR